MLLINKINATIRCYDLNQYAGYNLYAHPFWLKLQKETIIKKLINGTTLLVKIGFTRDHCYLVQAKEAEICIQVICLRRDLNTTTKIETKTLGN
jgi:hypothetical protein